MMRHLSNPDASHDDCQGVCIPKWAFKVGMGFIYVLALCVILTIAMVVSMMVMVSQTASEIRRTQVKNTNRLDRVVEEASREGTVRAVPIPD